MSLLSTVVAGCRLDAEAHLTVDDDAGGALAVALEVDEELADRGGEEVLGDLAGAVEPLEPWAVERFAAGRGVRLRAEFDDAEALQRARADLAEALSLPGVAPLEPFRIDRDGRRVEVRGGGALDVDDTARGVRWALGEEGASPEAALAEAVDFRLAVTLPGELVEHDGDRVESVDEGRQRVVWEVPAGGEARVTAVAERPAAWPWWLGAAGVAAAGAALLVLWARRRAARGRAGAPGGGLSWPAAP